MDDATRRQAMTVAALGAAAAAATPGRAQAALDKLFSVYAPPAEPEGAAFRTKAEAEEAERGLLGKAVDKVKEAIGQ